MAIKEKLLGLCREAEQRAAEKQRQREIAEEQRKAEEFTKKVRIEQAKQILKSKGILAIMDEVLEVLKQSHPDVELNIREAESYERIGGGRGCSKIGLVETAGIFVEKTRGEGQTRIQVGIELDSRNLTDVYVTDANSCYGKEKRGAFSIGDENLVPKLEAKLAELIFKQEYKYYDYEPVSFDYGPSW